MHITARVSTIFIRFFTLAFLDTWISCLSSARERISRWNHRFRCTTRRSPPSGPTVFSAKDSVVSYSARSSINRITWSVQLKVTSFDLLLPEKDYRFRRSKSIARTAYRSWHSSRCCPRQVCRGHIERTGSREIYSHLRWIQWTDRVKYCLRRRNRFLTSLSPLSRSDFDKRDDQVCEPSFPTTDTTFVYFSISFFFYSSVSLTRTCSNSTGVYWRSVRIICSPAPGIWLNECRHSVIRAISIRVFNPQCACTKWLSD